MKGLFNLDNKFFSAVNKVIDAFYASFLWLLFSFPVITFGTASTALYYTIHKTLRGNRGYIGQNFWAAFKSNFKQTTKIWLLMVAVLVLLITDYRIMMQNHDGLIGLFRYVFLFLIFFWLIWSIYIFAYSARFEGGIKNTMKNAAIIAIINFPWSLLALLLLFAGCLLVAVIPVLVMIVPAGVAFIYDIFLEKVFRKYMSEEDLQKEERMDKDNDF